MALFCATFKRGSISFFWLSLLNHIKVISYAISPICCLKYLYSCFYSHFCFLVIVILLNIINFHFDITGPYGITFLLQLEEIKISS